MDASRERAVEALMPVSRTMTAIVARTLGELTITVPQLRVLVLLASRGGLTLTTVADHLGVNASNASRTCEQLVQGGMVERVPGREDRRVVELSLSPDGRRLVDDLMESRRALLDAVVARMEPGDREALARGLEAFAEAVVAAPEEEVVGLPDGRILPWLL